MLKKAFPRSFPHPLTTDPPVERPERAPSLRITDADDDRAADHLSRGVVIGSPLDAAGVDPGYTFELTVSPGFDTTKPNTAKECQDDGIVVRDFGREPNITFVGIFDGHGRDGRKCAIFAAQEIAEFLVDHEKLYTDPMAALREASTHVNAKMHLSDFCRTKYSGTTACFGLLMGLNVFLANVGDSRAVLGRTGSKGLPEAVDLTFDHKPQDEPEKLRIELSGGTVSQQEYDPGQFLGPYRVFKRGTSAPGLAMSRSLGDYEAEMVGVIPDADCTQRRLQAEDRVLIVATDGLWEVFESQEAVEWVLEYMSDETRMNAMPVTQALVEEAQMRWTNLDDDDDIVVDDTTVLCITIPQMPKEYY